MNITTSSCGYKNSHAVNPLCLTNLICKEDSEIGAYRLVERITYGNILERSQAYVEVSLLGHEANLKFFEMIHRKSYEDWSHLYLRIYLFRAHLQPYLDMGLISGDKFSQFAIALQLSRFDKVVIDDLLSKKLIQPNTDYFYIRKEFIKIEDQQKKARRMTQKRMKENHFEMLQIHFDRINQEEIGSLSNDHKIAA
jgi:hypothetical protein